MKVLLFISAVLTLVTALLGWMNRSYFAETRQAKDDASRTTEEILKDVENNVITKINETKSLWQASKKQYAQDDFAKKKAIKETKDLADDNTAVVAKSDSTQKEIDAMVTNFNSALEGLGVSKPEELQAKRDAMKAEVAGLTEEVSKLDAEIGVLDGVLAENSRQLTKANEAQTLRSKVIALGSQQGVITAVNGDLAFVIVNMGKGDGVTPESRLLVKRGLQLIGKLKIREIHPNLTVGDIDMKTMKAAFAPGDQVIFDATN